MCKQLPAWVQEVGSQEPVLVQQSFIGKRMATILYILPEDIPSNPHTCTIH